MDFARRHYKHVIYINVNYYHKDSGLEINFGIRYRNETALLKTKETSGNAKSLKTILSHPGK